MIFTVAKHWLKWFILGTHLHFLPLCNNAMLTIKAQVWTLVLFHRKSNHTNTSFSAHQGTLFLKLSQQHNAMKSFLTDSRITFRTASGVSETNSSKSWYDLMPSLPRIYSSTRQGHMKGRKPMGLLHGVQQSCDSNHWLLMAYILSRTMAF